MVERFCTPEELFSFKLGSALTMERDGGDVLEELEDHAQRDEIKHVFSVHRQETRQHEANVEQCFKLLGEVVQGSPCAVIDALISEGRAKISQTDDSILDAVILMEAIESEHYEIAVYETLITNATAREASGVVDLLRQNLGQGKHALAVASETMRAIAEQGIAVPAAA